MADVANIIRGTKLPKVFDSDWIKYLVKELRLSFKIHTVSEAKVFQLLKTAKANNKSQRRFETSSEYS